MFVVSGRVKDGISLEQGEKEIDAILQEILKEGINEEELEKVKNQAESTIEFGEVEVMNRAMNLAFSALSGDANLVNLEGEKIKAVTRESVHAVAKKILKEENSSVLYYRSKKK
jgi:zinc protease